MLSKTKIKYIRSLEQKKYRKAEGVFVAEGPKVVGDLLETMDARLIVATDQWFSANGASLKGDCERIEVSENDLRKVSLLQHPQQVLGLFPQQNQPTAPPAHQLSLALDGVQDPGNLGTIIRIADWFGINRIYCSNDTADVYNPKVVQATMGSLARVDIMYTDLTELASSLPADYPVYGTLLDGDSIYKQQLTDYGLIIMGNEGNGISPELRPKINHKLLIPNFPDGRKTADSLNVAIATAITCAEFRRRY
ncbi:RNA methyltransferase [Prevotella sp. kh1p2]|uniref:RNA methyltransferase n=1 Tax=Prevotella sp. kh1p2 TaxID=1761883 RepID=UPI0008AD5CE8|nr:RNA methyltransferase [Prevotella sp. kh1p2]SET29569.1 RNA methyltransferase, TrmH family [Prevotella sp. kh1p2]